MPHEIQDRKQLFIDRRFIADSEGVELVMNQPTLHPGPVLTADRPWEARGICLYNTVLRERGRFRLWYGAMMHVGLPREGAIRLCYAESDDGIHFERPVLGLIEFQGSKRNNIVAPPEERQSMQGATVYRDDRAPASERYKLWSKFRPADAAIEQGAVQGLWAMRSPDGLKWELYENQPNPPHQTSDTQNMFFYDDRIGAYVGYTRCGRTQHGTEAAVMQRARYRSVERIVSRDFRHWEGHDLVFEADATDLAAPLPPGQDPRPPPVDYYNSCAMKYEHAQDAYFMFPSAFHHWDVNFPDTFDVQMLTSRDGIRWDRAGGRRPFMRRGLDGSPTGGMIMINPWLIPMGDELWFYYVGAAAIHGVAGVGPTNSQLFRASIRLDGFISADAGLAGGQLLTPPLVFSGRRLLLNVDLSSGGWLQAEITDAAGRPLEGFTMREAAVVTGNAVDKEVPFTGNLARLAGRPIRLRLRVREAKLYAFCFAE